MSTMPSHMFEPLMEKLLSAMIIPRPATGRAYPLARPPLVLTWMIGHAFGLLANQVASGKLPLVAVISKSALIALPETMPAQSSFALSFRVLKLPLESIAGEPAN